MLAGSGFSGSEGSLLENYVEQYSSALTRRRATVVAQAARIEAELAYKARGEFLANMNHELRTPLNAIVGFASMMKEAKSYGLSEEQTSEYLDYILESAELLLGHINTILELAAAESGGAKMKWRVTDVAEIVSSAIERHEPLAEEAAVRLSASVDPGLPPVNIDPDRIDTALHHLIENAIAYCEDHGTVTVLARHGRQRQGVNWVYFAIEDTGEGMTPEELDRAMRAFEQVHQGLHRRHEGTGLGLPIAKSFIELNGGTFDIKSRKGEGTKVRFALPAAAIERDSDQLLQSQPLRKSA